MARTPVPDTQVSRHKEHRLIKRTIALALLAGVLSLAFAACSGTESSTATQPSSPSPVPRAPTEEPADGETATGEQEATGTEVFVSLRDPGGSGSYVFDADDFEFDVGDTITFVVESETEFHTFTVTDLDINISVPGGATEASTVTFDTAGTFNLICIPHQALGMVGTITVR
jgi:plastocyanin